MKKIISFIYQLRSLASSLILGLGVVLVTLIFFGFSLFWPTSEEMIPIKETLNEVYGGGDKSQIISSLKDQSDDERQESMKIEYEVLEKQRRALKQRLARLKHSMWGLEFEKAKAKDISEILINAHKFIKNPDMLGAFSDITEIRDETLKIKFANKSLDQISEIIEQKNNND